MIFLLHRSQRLYDRYGVWLRNDLATDALHKDCATFMISIITPALNAASVLERNLSMLARQQVRFEHVVQHGESKDSTVELIKRYAALYNLHAHQEPDSGLYEAVVMGISKVNGDILCWLGADDYYLPLFCSDFATSQIAAALRKPALVAMGGRHRARLSPWGDTNRGRVVRYAIDCYGCNWRCKYEGVQCIQEIFPADAARQLSDLFENLLPNACNQDFTLASARNPLPQSQFNAF